MIPHDLRHAWRSIANAPSISTIVVLTLAVGIGSTTAIFSLLNAVLLRPLPYPSPEELAFIWTPHKIFRDLPLNTLGPSNADAVALKRDIPSIANLALFQTHAFSLATAETAIRVSGARVNANFFSTLQVRPLFGRTIGVEDDRAGSDQVVISYGLWQSAMGGDSNVLGRSFGLDGRTFQVVGVMPPEFGFPRAADLIAGDVEGRATDLWVPLAIPPQDMESRDISDNYTIARLRPGITVAQAQSEIAPAMARLDLLHPPEWRGWSTYVQSLEDASIGSIRRGMWLIFGAVSLVLLLACSNAAHLLLARAADRAHEMGVRSALGASRARLLRQTLTEASLLALAGGAVGVALASGANHLLISLNPGIPRLEEASLDGRVLAFTFVASVATGVIFGLVPAMWGSTTDVLALLRRGQDRATTADTRVGPALVVAEVVLAVVLLVGGGLLLRSYQNVRRIDPGFTSSAMTLRVALDDRYAQPGQRINFFETLLTEMEHSTAATSIGIVDALPLSKSERLNSFEIEGVQVTHIKLVQTRAATPGYFAAARIPVLAGRPFVDSDRAGQPQVLLVNQTFANVYFSGQSPLGHRVRFRRDMPWAPIVGVVGDVRHSNVEDLPQPQVYESLWQSDVNRAYLVVGRPVTASTSAATASEWATAVANASRLAIRRIDPSLAVTGARPMTDLVHESRARREFQTLLGIVLSGVALLLAATGLYGVMAHMVKRRTRELGIRLALGAQRRDVLVLVLRRGLGLTIGGLAIGLTAAMFAARLVASHLYGITSTDGLTVGGVSLLLIGVAAISCLLPSLRAGRLDPVQVFRGD